MDEDDIQECVDDMMTAIREQDAYALALASKSDTRSYLQGIIDACKVEIEALGDPEDDDEESEEG